MTDKSCLLSALDKTNVSRLGYPLYFYQQTGSTNDQAVKMGNQRRLPVGTTFYTNRQTAGKGSDGKTWESRPGASLTFSVILDPIEQNRTITGFYPAVALSRLLRDDYDLDAHVKWPNDVLVGSKKIAGILCQTTANDQMVVGVGINLNHDNFDGELADKATSVYLETENVVGVEDFFAQFMARFEDVYNQGNDIITAWKDQTKMIGQDIILTNNGIKKTGQVQDITKHGFLVLMGDDGHQQILTSPRNIDIEQDY